MGNKSVQNTPGYKEWLKDLKARLRSVQLKAAVNVNSILLQFYWELGADIVEKQRLAAWGSGFLKQLSRDLMIEFPDMKGFSHENLKYIRRWYQFYNTDVNNKGTSCAPIERKQNYSQLFLIPWGHNRVIISKCNSIEEAFFYIDKTIGNGWSRIILTHQIESGLYNRQGKAVTNFSETLPEIQSDLANQLLKDPYNFDFLTFTDGYREKELEQGLVKHITQFLLELGSGFAYLGKQVPLQVGERDFFVDLLFYHTKLHCHVIIELKMVDFEPEHVGKFNFYIKAVDEQIKQDGDNPSIGILLCKNKDKVVVEYALSDIHKPLGVSEYELTQSLPDDLKSSLPSIEEIEAEFGEEFGYGE